MLKQDKEYSYTRQRRFFGRQPRFSERKELIVSIPPNHALMSSYVLRDPVDRETNLSTQFAKNEINTERVQVNHRGISHIEGGWPKEVNPFDEDAVTRYRKKIERDEKWLKNISEMQILAMEAINQNNAINIYETFFEDMEEPELCHTYEVHRLDEIRDVKSPARQVVYISWRPNDDEKFAVAYGLTNTELTYNHSTVNYIWDLNDPVKPSNNVKSDFHSTCIEWNPIDIQVLAAGLQNGAVCKWDLRVGENPIAITAPEFHHKAVCTTLKWAQLKNSMQFYTGSLDGTVKFWDERDLSESLFTFYLDPVYSEKHNPSRLHGCCVLELEQTIPYRFHIGSDKGHIFIGNRKAKLQDKMLCGCYPIMSDPIMSLERNPTELNYFLVAGDSCAKIWTETCPNKILMEIPNQSSSITCATWSRTRSSLFFTGLKGGQVHFWDLVLDSKEPIYRVENIKSPIKTIKGNVNGSLLAVGTEKGNISILKLDESLVMSKAKDNSKLVKYFESRLKDIQCDIVQCPEVEDSEDEKILEEENMIIDVAKSESETLILPKNPEPSEKSEDNMVLSEDNSMSLDLEKHEENFEESVEESDTVIDDLEEELYDDDDDDDEKNFYELIPNDDEVAGESHNGTETDNKSIETTSINTRAI